MQSSFLIWVFTIPLIKRWSLKIVELKENMPEVEYFINTFMTTCLATADKS